MKHRYILAYIPKAMFNSRTIIDYAQKHVSVSGKYMLGENSLPHVTVHQFRVNSSEINEKIELVEKSDLVKQIKLSFQDVSCVTFDNVTFWASLMPDQRDVLISVHKKTADLLNLPIKQAYDPHMTLFNSLNPQYECLVKETQLQYNIISAEFTLAIGECDAVGQFTKTLFIFNKNRV